MLLAGFVNAQDNRAVKFFEKACNRGNGFII